MKLPRRKFLFLAASAAALPTVSRIARAQAYPARPVTMVVPFAAGGGLDTYGRVIAAALSEALHQQVIVENIGGAGGMTGSSRVAKASPDGYQILLGHSGTHAYNQTLYKKPLYDALTDFAPVTIIVNTTKILVTRNDFPSNTLPEFLAYAKVNQAKLQYASAGAGSEAHISCVLFNSKSALMSPIFLTGGPARPCRTSSRGGSITCVIPRPSLWNRLRLQHSSQLHFSRRAETLHSQRLLRPMSKASRILTRTPGRPYSFRRVHPTRLCSTLPRQRAMCSTRLW
jgi:Tripartite tricarboxylate transporter family receptor